MKTPNSSSAIDGNRKRLNQCRPMIADINLNRVYMFTLLIDYHNNDFDKTENQIKAKLQTFFESVTIK